MLDNVRTLKMLRNNRGITLHELSEMIGSSLSLVSKFERGERTINRKWAHLLAQALNVDVSEIVGANVSIEARSSLHEKMPWFVQMVPMLLETGEVDREIPINSTVYYNPNGSIEAGAIVVIEFDEKRHVRRVSRTGALRFDAVSWSSHHETIFFGPAVKILGVVCGFCKPIGIVED